METSSQSGSRISIIDSRPAAPIHRLIRCATRIPKRLTKYGMTSAASIATPL